MGPSRLDFYGVCGVIAQVKHGAQRKFGAPSASTCRLPQFPFKSGAKFNQGAQVGHVPACSNAVAVRAKSARTARVHFKCRVFEGSHTHADPVGPQQLASVNEIGQGQGAAQAAKLVPIKGVRTLVS